jgi:hypothetical protein
VLRGGRNGVEGEWSGAGCCCEGKGGVFEGAG